jgi:RNA-binding protein
MQLTEKQRRHLKGLAHPLKPVILLGNAGLTDAVVAETSRALADHELIKVRLPGLDRLARDAALQTLAERTGSALVSRIGHVAVLFRPREKVSRFVLPA